MSNLGTNERVLRVAIVGSGPSGFYAADAVTKSELNVIVDMFDRLPAPYGLVRYGVAPDHAKIKNVTKVYERIADKENVSFFGNVTIGRDVSVEELKKYYDAIIFTNGAETDKKLGIPGEDLPGSYTATEFVAWYNGHPDYADHKFDLSQEVAVIIGQGNVAMDVCRILAKTVDELKTTDIAQHALDALVNSKIKEIHMVGRRGPAQTAFTPVEIKEFGELEDCNPVVKAEDMEINEASQEELADPKNMQKKKNYDRLKEYSELGEGAKSKKFICHFLKSPVELVGDGKVEKVILEKNALSGEANKQKARGSGEKEELACGLFFRSVGYRGLSIEGVPFHEQWGSILHEEGRVVDENNKVVAGLYTAGWIKRGPSGVVGTNKPDSEETVKHLLEDVASLTLCEIPDTSALLNILKEKKVRVVTLDDWKKIDVAEIENGQKIGKPREKFVSLNDMLAVL
ncbi:Ferredoxin--NADP(+) reductase, actinobacterial (eukaryote-like) type [hydrothermal vent metagenome]|uniref:Ferredoxin--NADP(+) reductase, actinobacterial (Eukaryote-like) type n=1 Tax=hydrothermal vent metagenome TaxID=652676 RepID=A0A3B1DZW8_9ZZZZ